MHKMIATAAAMLAGLAMAGGALAEDKSAQIYTAWATHEGGEVTFFDCGEQLCGKITKLKPPGPDVPTEDIHNPDPEMRDRPLLGLVMFTGFEKDGDGKWEDGEIYNTTNGKTYRSKLKIKDDGTLKMSGCVMFICESYDWHRADSAGASAGE